MNRHYPTKNITKHGMYTVLCAVLRERWGKGVSVVCAWLLPEALVQRSNIAHNVERLMQLMSEHELNLKHNKSAGWRYTKQNKYGWI